MLPDGIFSSNKFTGLVVASNIVSIGPGAFKSNQISSLEIPSSVSSIGHGAFFPTI